MTQKEIKEVLTKVMEGVEERAQQNLKDNDASLFNFNRGYASALWMVCNYMLTEDGE